MMNVYTTTIAVLCLSLAASAGFAQDTMKKDNMSKDGMMKKEMTMQECKDHMATAKKDDAMMKSDDAMMMKHKTCVDVMKKGGMGHDGMMKKDAMPAEPMKK
jgi:hypothetical protein